MKLTVCENRVNPIQRITQVWIDSEFWAETTVHTNVKYHLFNFWWDESTIIGKVLQISNSVNIEVDQSRSCVVIYIVAYAYAQSLD